MPALARVEGEPVGIRASAREQRGQRDHQREQGLVEGPEAPGDPLLDVPGVVATLDRKVSGEEIRDREQRSHLPVRGRPRFEDQMTRKGGGSDELPEETRLPDPRLAGHSDHLAPAEDCLLACPLQPLELVSAADEAGESAHRHSGRQPRADGSRPDETIDVDRSRDPLHAPWPQRLHLDEAIHESLRCRRHQGGPGLRELLHARRQMRRVAHRRVVQMAIVAEGPHHDLAGIQADPYADLERLLPEKCLRVVADRLLHPEGRLAGADRMILVRQRRAKQRHDAVAHHLVDGALVAVDCGDHPLEHWIQDASCLFRIAVDQQLHRALEVGEEDRDLLALALEGGLRGEDLLGEVLRRV